jgi:hypothetical protein
LLGLIVIVVAVLDRARRWAIVTCYFCFEIPNHFVNRHAAVERLVARRIVFNFYSCLLRDQPNQKTDVQLGASVGQPRDIGQQSLVLRMFALRAGQKNRALNFRGQIDLTFATPATWIAFRDRHQGCDVARHDRISNCVQNECYHPTGLKSYRA